MSKSMYRDRGMHMNVPPATIRKLIHQYCRAKDRRARQGFFLGTEFLREMTDALETGGFDGLWLRFGMSGSTIDLPPVIELIGTQVELEGNDSMAVQREGLHYCTVGQQQTNPPSLPCPPMGNPDGN